MTRFRKYLIWMLLLIGLLFAMPQLISYASGLGEPVQSWSTARRDRTYTSPSPESYSPAVIQVFGAKTWGWRGRFAIHTWIAMKEKGAAYYDRYEVIGWRAYSGNPALTVSRGRPDNYWFGNSPVILSDIRGEAAEKLIPRLKAVIASYPHKDAYRLWPGPNSNTFIAHIGRQIPALNLDLPPTAIGKDYIAEGRVFGSPISGQGFQLSLLGYGGFVVSPVEGLEIHFMGLTTGIDFDDYVLKFPGFGRVSLK